MGTPTRTQLAEALAEAARMREAAEDPHFVAKALLSHNYRIHVLEQVLDAAGHYLHSGLAPHEHTELVRAIAAAEATARPAGSEQEDDFGLE